MKLVAKLDKYEKNKQRQTQDGMTNTQLFKLLIQTQKENQMLKAQLRDKEFDLEY